MTGLRLAIAMFTALPVPRSWHGRDPITRDDARATTAWLPLVGATVGAFGGLIAAAVLARHPGNAGIAALLAVAGVSVATRGLHLDGLADTADGLGSRAPAERALEVMRRSDIGPFGVVTLVLVLLGEVLALAGLPSSSDWRILAALVVAEATGRLAVVHATLPGVSAARPDGFGALVAGATTPATAIVLTVATLGGGALLGWSVDGGALRWPVAQAIGLVAASGLRRHTSRRLGGTTGDVFGALVVTASTVTLLGFVVL